ncbi:MAG: N-acetylmuramoyl-L-alanine amidase, partial [Spartobacteria bacterium]
SPTTAEETREASEPATRQSTTVVVDAGHGGFDRGGIPGQRVPESVMTLDVAQRVKRLLEAGGYRVVMTRNSDVFIPLGTRVAIANSYRNAIFVCIHFNSASRRGANGIETYFYSRESLALASAIHYNVVAVTPTPNRGVRRRGFFVLRRTTIPSVLVECGFLTNPSEAQAAQSSAYQEKLAQAIVRGIRSRGSVASTSSARAGSADAVPLQPFIDQTRMRNRDVGKSKRISKKSKSSKSKKSSSSDSSSKKKKKTSSPAPEN